MNRRTVIDRAVGGVLAPHIRDFRKGACEVADLEEMARRRAQSIREEYSATIRRLQRRAQRCAACPAPSTTVIAGRPYCDDHAKTAPRLTFAEAMA